ncbi:autotransporter outer membrane beta-barrel domain-containing protein [Fulvimonas soli]|uniref:Outer membrane lipase/esterase n=1 Tax=Fulvimonas soli TaxID=155197 RepID=A0A316HPT9_9GAMM|nr:autotransporter domain-containing protein [Fulvimonas soli]PWK82103.1 outer membrane lipase/esterase [Fulvimonas soli]TNY27026.1 autotransporter outer membrane beta-barrel domain-containing protein [Fulvimonas soli]
MPRTRLLAGAIAGALLFSNAAAATDFSKVVVIGDSLSDAGNISLATAPGVQPPLRFTTNPGQTAAELVAAGLGLPVTPSLTGGTDYAFGGAGLVHNSSAGPIPTLPQQLQMYLAANGGKADANALYQVWGGANDIFYLTATTTDQNALAAGAVTAAQTEIGLLGQLQAAGARYVVVYNLPDIGKTPSALAGGAAAVSGGTQLSVLYNSTLNTGLIQLNSNGLNVIPVNTYALIDEVVANPAAYGFSNVTAPACGAGASSVQCGPQGSGLPYTYAPGTDQTYLFADGVHPTSAAHAMLAQVVLSEIAAPGQVSLLGEAPLAAAQAQYRAIRNQLLADGQGSDTRLFASVDYGQQHFDAAGNAPKTSSDNVDLTLGADARAGEHVSLGVALSVGQHDADFAHGGGGYKMQDVSGLGYALYHNGGGYIGGFASFGQSNFKDIDRRIQIGAATRTESGKADGSHLGGGVEGGWWFRLAEGLQTGPFAHVEWQTVKVNGYTEGGNDSTAMWFGRQQRDALISSLGWRLQGQWKVGDLAMAPYAELSWNHDSKAEPRAIKAGLNSLSGSFELPGYSPDKTWGSADLGLSAQLTPSVTSWIALSGRFSDDSQRDNGVNMGVKISF